MGDVQNLSVRQPAITNRMAMHVRDYYSERLVRFMLLPDDPFEGEHEPQALHFVAVVRPENGDLPVGSTSGQGSSDLDVAKEVDAMAALAYEVDDAFGQAFISTVHVISEEGFNRGSGYVAEKARQEDNALWPVISLR